MRLASAWQLLLYVLKAASVPARSPCVRLALPRTPQLALFRCLLAKDIDGAAQLLAEAPSGSLALEGPQGFTALHAAVGACGPAVPLLPALVAAGTPLDVCLEAMETDDGQQGNGNLPGSVLAFMRACGMQCVYYEQFGRLQVGMTPLGFAAA